MTPRQAAMAFLYASAALFFVAVAYFFWPEPRRLAPGQPDWVGFADGKGSTIYTADARPRPEFVNGPLAAARARLSADEVQDYVAAMTEFEKASTAISYNKCDRDKRQALVAAYQKYRREHGNMVGRVISSLRAVCRGGAEWCPAQIEGSAIRDVIMDLGGVDQRDIANWKRANKFLEEGLLSLTDLAPGLLGTNAEVAGKVIQEAACKGGAASDAAGFLLGQHD
jgi:hypothetical protein